MRGAQTPVSCLLSKCARAQSGLLVCELHKHLCTFSKQARHTRLPEQVTTSLSAKHMEQCKLIAQGVASLSQCCSITDLDCSSSKITLRMSARLRDALVKCSQLMRFSLAFWNMRDPAPVMLAKVVESCTMLEHLNVSFCHLGEKGMLQLAPALRACTSLRELDLTTNDLEESGAGLLASVLQTSLTYLKLNHNKVCIHTRARACVRAHAAAYTTH